MNDKVLVLLFCGTDNTNRSTRGIHLATLAHKQGNEKELPEKLAELQKRKSCA